MVRCCCAFDVLPPAAHAHCRNGVLDESALLYGKHNGPGSESLPLPSLTFGVGSEVRRAALVVLSIDCETRVTVEACAVGAEGDVSSGEGHGEPGS